MKRRFRAGVAVALSAGAVVVGPGPFEVAPLQGEVATASDVAEADPSATGASGRYIPIGQWGVGNSPIMENDDLLAIRFVLDQPTTLYRFITGFNLEGVYTDEGNMPAPLELRTKYYDKRVAPAAEGGNPRFPPPPPELPSGWSTGDGRLGYAHGDGGTIRARLVAVKNDGSPDLGSVLAEERVSAVQRYRESKAAYGTGKTQLLYIDFGSVDVAADTMYAIVITNSHPDPLNNYFSMNFPATKASEAGPHEVNTIDKNAPGAILGLDPREALAWSRDDGARWVWGHNVGGQLDGEYRFGYYANSDSDTTDQGTRMPWYGWQTSPTAAPKSNQPYYSYREQGSFTLRCRDVPRTKTLTEAGGYAPVGQDVGVVTVRNLTPGHEQVGTTSSLGTGIVKGPLDYPVTVYPGDTYEISNSGTVLKSEAAPFIVRTFGVGSGDWPFETVGHGADRAELFALPHPYFAAASSATSD